MQNENLRKSPPDSKIAFLKKDQKKRRWFSTSLNENGLLTS